MASKENLAGTGTLSPVESPGLTPNVTGPAGFSGVPLFGGNKGGRKRKDGLKPGSPEALAADRQKDADRKKNERAAAAALHDPAPLPGIPAPDFYATAPKALPVDGLPGTPMPTPGIVAQWQSKDVEKLVRQFISLTEELCNKQILNKCHKARLPQDVVAEIERDAEWSKSAKAMLEEGGSELAARYLNSAGISPELKPFLLMGIAAMEIAVNHQKILKRLDKLIAEQKPA